MLKAIDIAKWFIYKNCDTPRNTFDGNMKLQKLLFFSQLIHLVRTENILFDDPILAFENGSVVEDVRLTYKNNNYDLIKESKEADYDFLEEELQTLQITHDIFCDIKAKELSDLNHLFKSWKLAYDGSIVSGRPQKRYSEIQIDNLKKYDLDNIRQMLHAYEITKNSTDPFEVINGVTFYYDVNTVTMTDELIEELSASKWDEDSYYVYKDKELGLVFA